MSDVAPELKRKPGRPKKRKDPADGPVDGDFRQDMILDKEPGKRYALLDEKEDAAKFTFRGYRRVEPREGSPRPVWQDPLAGNSHYSVKGLVLYEANDEHVARYDKQALQQSDERMANIKRAAEATGGYMTQTTETE